MIASFFRFLFTTVFFCVLLAVLAGSWVLLQTRSAGPLVAAKVIVIEPGQASTAIATSLQDAQIVRSKWIFLAAVMMNGDWGRLQAGEYEFLPQARAVDIVRDIADGRVLQHKLTIAEGLTVAEIIALVNGAEALNGAITTIPDEGQLLPDTYAYTRGMSRQAVLDRMALAMNKAIDGLWAKRPANFPLASPKDVITLASIVEKETGQADERPHVAGVFLNRLRLGMKLQSDPTVIYALTKGQAPLGRALTTNDLLKTDSPYNTYRVAGLPPAPIANPGLASLQAIFAPLVTQDLYFVADGTGGHAFAATLAEHNANVARWRKINAESQK